MDNTGNSHLAGSNDADKPIPFDNGLDRQPPPSGTPAAGSPSVSRAPLNLGGSSPVTPRPAPKVATPTPPPARGPVERTAPTERITGVKTFFTKLHPGAMEFLDDQVNAWLKDNPSIHVKHTNITTGEVQAKKTEPNIIICLWY